MLGRINNIREMNGILKNRQEGKSRVSIFRHVRVQNEGNILGREKTYEETVGTMDVRVLLLRRTIMRVSHRVKRNGQVNV